MVEVVVKWHGLELKKIKGNNKIFQGIARRSSGHAKRMLLCTATIAASFFPKHANVFYSPIVWLRQNRYFRLRGIPFLSTLRFHFAFQLWWWQQVTLTVIKKGTGIRRGSFVSCTNYILCVTKFAMLKRDTRKVQYKLFCHFFLFSSDQENGDFVVNDKHDESFFSKYYK